MSGFVNCTGLVHLCGYGEARALRGGLGQAEVHQEIAQLCVAEHGTIYTACLLAAGAAGEHRKETT